MARAKAKRTETTRAKPGSAKSSRTPSVPAEARPAEAIGATSTPAKAASAKSTSAKPTSAKSTSAKPSRASSPAPAAAGRRPASPTPATTLDTPTRDIPTPDGAPTALALPPAPLSAEMSAYLDKCREKIGFVPNVLAAYAHDDAKLSAFAAFYNGLMLAKGMLTKLEREMIAVVVSAANRCHYCLVAHGAAVRTLSGDPALGEALATNWRAAALTPRHEAMLAFSWRIAERSSEVGEADRQAMREAGFTDVDIWDVAAVASFFAMSNRLASATGMRPNPEYTYESRSASASARAPGEGTAR